MIKKILFTLFACLLIQSDTHAAGFFNKAARGLYQTTKWGLIAVPLAVPVVSKLGVEYSQRNQPELWQQRKRTYETMDSLEHYSLASLKEEILPEYHGTVDMVDKYLKELGSKILDVPEEKILIKVDILNPSTFHAPLVKNGNKYHVIHLGLGDATLNLWENLVDHIKYNKPTAAPFFITHEIAHGKFEHGKKKGSLALGAIIGGYIAMTGLLLKKGNFLAISKQSSTASIALKTALAASLPVGIYKTHTHAHNALSRKYEWQADNFAISQIDDPEILEAAASLFDKHHEQLEEKGIRDPEHPESKDRAENLRKAAATLRLAFSTKQSRSIR